MQKKQQNNYLSYLIRLSLANDGENPAWRISLESTLTREHKGFGGIDELVTFLRQEMGRLSSEDQDKNNPLASHATR